MYFSTLTELQLIMRGHGIAFWQLGYLGDSNSFYDAFASYIQAAVNPAPSLCAGWASAVLEIATERGQDEVVVFSELVTSFLSEWTTKQGETIK